MTESTTIWGISGIFSVCSFFVFVLGTTEFRAYSFPFPYYYQSGDDIILDSMFQFCTLPSSENISTSSGRHHIMTVASIVTLSQTHLPRMMGHMCAMQVRYQYQLLHACKI